MARRKVPKVVEGTAFLSFEARFCEISRGSRRAAVFVARGALRSVSWAVLAEGPVSDSGCQFLGGATLVTKAPGRIGVDC